MKKVCIVFFLIFSITFTALAETPRWEYFLLVVPGPLQMSPFPTNYMPSVTNRFWTFPKISTALNDLGFDGWEMVSSVFDPSGNYVVTLKKRISN